MRTLPRSLSTPERLAELRRIAEAASAMIGEPERVEVEIVSVEEEVV